jgi:exo-1,4-beta-D-glucosaminidase
MRTCICFLLTFVRLFRLKTDYAFLVAVLFVATLNAPGQSRVEPLQSARISLRNSWSLQSSARVQASGEIISSAGFRIAGWYPTKVPSTVLAALTDNHIYPDPYFGMNLRAIPGCTYPIGSNFSNLPMTQDSPFRGSWWYRTEFRLPKTEEGRQIALHFDGINYRANIWLNGHQIADAKDVAGTFRLYEFNITEIAKPGALNTLAVEVFPPEPKDLALTWVDWSPAPPDKNMGLWHDVYVSTSGPVTVRYPQVITDVDLSSLAAAQLTVSAELRNNSKRTICGTLNGHIEGIQFSQPVSLAPDQTRTIDFTPEQFRQLNISHPRLWWPTEIGEQKLYTLELKFQAHGRISDSKTVRFGIRKITSDIEEGTRIFKVNGRRVLIRGGGWAPDMLLRSNPERIEQEFQYVKDMHLNAIRLEGKLESDYFYDLADRYGILILVGWGCCDQWEHWEHKPGYREGPLWDRETYAVARHSQEDQLRRLRNHPGVLAWFNGSDNPPPSDVERMYLSILEECRWPNPFLSSATAKASTITGSSAVKMAGPYDWVPPSYWLLDKDRGGSFGFATEISPGPAIPPIESLRRMLPKDHLWPIDYYWAFHAGGSVYSSLEIFTHALNARYGTAKNVEDYATKAQLMTYEAQRAMFEGYARNKYRSSGVIQWMLNNAWPSMIWHLYDYYLRPGGGYFGTKKACEPIHVQYSYDDRSIVVVNGTYLAFGGMRVTAKVFDMNMVEKYSKTSYVGVPADGVVSAFVLPDLKDLTSTYFLKLTLEDQNGKLASSNFYWLSTRDDVLDWANATKYYTPTSSFADFAVLQSLPQVELRTTGYVEAKGDENLVHVTLENPSRSLAFAVRLQIKGGLNGEEVLPILWEDNYFALMPGEKRKVTARYRDIDLEGNRPVLLVSGWNVEPIQISLR